MELRELRLYDKSPRALRQAIEDAVHDRLWWFMRTLAALKPGIRDALITEWQNKPHPRTLADLQALVGWKDGEPPKKIR
jgi:hypothetical protein